MMALINLDIGVAHSERCCYVSRMPGRVEKQMYSSPLRTQTSLIRYAANGICRLIIHVTDKVDTKYCRARENSVFLSISVVRFNVISSARLIRDRYGRMKTSRYIRATRIGMLNEDKMRIERKCRKLRSYELHIERSIRRTLRCRSGR